LNQNIKKIEKKRINMRTAVSIIEKLEHLAKDDNIVSLRRFVAVNFDVLSRLVRYSGKNIKTLYEDLKASGLDVGTYHGFRSACYRAGLRRRPKRRVTVFQEPADIFKKMQSPQASPKNSGVTSASNDCEPEVSKYNPALPPVILPGGIEAIIDPETGAKRFEI
jgi:hypothetical protein